MNYIDTYISAAEETTLASFCASFENRIGPAPGRAAIAASTDANGNIIPSQPAKGDPALFYTLIRSTFDITPSVAAPMAIVDAATGASVVGVFA